MRKILLALLLTLIAFSETQANDWGLVASLSPGRMYFSRNSQGHVTPQFGVSDIGAGVGARYAYRASSDQPSWLSLAGVLFYSYSSGQELSSDLNRRPLSLIPSFVAGFLNDRIELGVGYDLMLGVSAYDVPVADIQRLNIFIGTGTTFNF